MDLSLFRLGLAHVDRWGVVAENSPIGDRRGGGGRTPNIFSDVDATSHAHGY